ncbi:MAG: M23 family metallopeptidase, partial [Melioribacteraceae bacterium]|nr:M23 family metallopeptidase [Melioribacteraceae bacterium]
INDKFKTNLDLFNNLPAIRPVNSSIGDRFGMRMHPILKRKRMHHGLDFLSNVGEPVHSPGDGIVTFVGNKGGYGKVLRINHGYGYETLYAHLSKFKVKKGEKIKRGDLIALTGNSGSLSTGPHLHYEVRHKGVSLNPRNFLFEDIRLFDSAKKYLASK